MFKKEISYKDFDGNQKKTMIYMHMSKREMFAFLARWGVNGGDDIAAEFTKLANRFASEKDISSMLNLLDDFILSSYGVRSDDGLRFIKNDKVRNDFEQSLAHEALLDDLVDNPESTKAIASGALGVAVSQPKKPSDFQKAKSNRHHQNKSGQVSYKSGKRLAKAPTVSPTINPNI